MTDQLADNNDDETTRRRTVRYDREPEEPPSVAVATALAAHFGEDPTGTSLRLYDYVDPEALDALFHARNDGSPRADGVVRFPVGSATVVVRPERVTVYPGS